MSGETSVTFLIPESSCQKDFEVWALFADGAKESVLICDWVDKYHCSSAPGYTHTLENTTALITVPLDLEKKPDHFICNSLFNPKTDASWCYCRKAEFIPGQPDSDSPGQVALIVGLSVPLVLLFLVLVLVLVGFLICKYYFGRTLSMSTRDPNVRTGEFEPLRNRIKYRADRPSSDPNVYVLVRKDVPHISATDSQKTLLTFFPCGTVSPRKRPMTQKPHPEFYNTRRESV
ncbi:uncharacterized protein LOC112568128 [Pomacea canaliculata]|uniref:uncharacterized protein LOC112568128 n=1 Tax=Pomacea canaliculata TaxID=400727 RepID=UPI000D73643C|nr:uncharacterized protein LOC112568128 [Pomacea canaliculata]